MVTVIEKEIYGSSLCFWGTTRPTNTITTIPLGESYALDVSSLMLYRNREPREGGGFPPSQKIINKISIEPVWEYSYLSPSAFDAYETYFKDVLVQPFIATPPLNNLTQNFFGFSATNNLEWKTNQFGPATQTTVVNDVHYNDKFVLQPWEDLKIKLLGATEVDDMPGTTPPVKTQRLAIWNDLWINYPSPVVKVRIELEEFNPSSQYFTRVSLNDITLDGEALLSDQDITLLDMRTGSLTLGEPPFNRLFPNNYFQVQNLDFRGAYPWGGTSTTQFMYSILLETEGIPSATRYIRKYVRFSGDDTSDLEINGLLTDIGPINMQRGHRLVLRLYKFESEIPVLTEAHSARQMPAFWLNGAIT